MRTDAASVGVAAKRLLVEVLRHDPFAFDRFEPAYGMDPEKVTAAWGGFLSSNPLVVYRSVYELMGLLDRHVPDWRVETVPPPGEEFRLSADRWDDVSFAWRNLVNATGADPDYLAWLKGGDNAGV